MAQPVRADDGLDRGGPRGTLSPEGDHGCGMIPRVGWFVGIITAKGTTARAMIWPGAVGLVAGLVISAL